MIGKYIASRRKELRISQKDLAEKLNVTAGAVSQWEHGRTMPDISMYPKIADALNTTVGALFGEGKKETPIQKDERLVRGAEVLSKLNAQQWERLLGYAEGLLQTESEAPDARG